MEKRALGKGLSALIPEKEVEIPESGVSYVKTEMVSVSSVQPRKDYDEAKLLDLKKSIQEKGILQPILIRKKTEGFEVIAGERRLRAATSLGLPEIPAIIKDVSDKEALVLALIENIQRDELNAVEEAEAYKRLIEEFQYTHEEVARSVSKERSTISNLLRLLNLPLIIKKGLAEEKISMGHARSLLSLGSLDEQTKMYDLILKKGLSVREVENLVKKETGGGARREKLSPAKDHELIALEEELQKKLGTKVRLLTAKKRGKIVIEYYSIDDLDRILKLMGKN